MTDFTTPPPLPHEPHPESDIIIPPPVPETTHIYGEDSPEDVPPMPRTYMGWCIVCCLACVITGVIGLVFASQVHARWRVGDYEGARQASANVRLMLLASVVFGLINVPYLLLYCALT